MSNEPNLLTIIDLLNRSSKYLKEKKIENPRLNAERLLANVLDISRVQLYLQYDRTLIPEETNRYRDLIRRRSQNEPLQYILGQTEFMGIAFTVAPGVLIPRPETELLVEKTLALKNRFASAPPRIWDIGTGSGCIAVSLALHWPGCQLTGSDVSGEALAQAEENARRHGVSGLIRFIRHDILQESPPYAEPPDIIISNPPYISQKEYEGLADEIKNFEPPEALTDGENGLRFYDRIFTLIRNGLATKFCLLELSGFQTDAIIKQAEELSAVNIEIFEDLNSIPRVLLLEIR